MPPTKAGSIRQELDAGLETMGLATVTETDRQRLLAFLELLQRWNRTYNLTAISDPPEMVRRHILDSLSILPHLPAGRILDVGTGAGLPGVPLAICRPGQEFHLLDGNGKKVRFLFQARLELGLDNVSLHHARAEDFKDSRGFDGILSRAVASLAELLRVSAHLLAEGGALMAMKGETESAELDGVRPPYTVDSRVDLVVPGIAQRRQLIRITRPGAPGTR